MFSGMSDDIKAPKKNDNKRVIEDWLNGDGGKVMALAMIALGVWFVVSLVWR